ncbi:MAG: hypothetical protein ACI3X1_02820 [Eubacteriales bacterium]
MKKKDKKQVCEACHIDGCEEIIADCTTVVEKPDKPQIKKEKPSAGERIYNFLDKAEKIAIILAKSNKSKKKKAKRQLKKDKKSGKIDKKTGAVTLGKVKKEKIQKPMKRYKPPKKK